MGASWSVIKTHGVTTEGMGSVEPEELSDDWVNVEMPREEGKEIVTSADTTLADGS